jgi:hypothetical protein
VAHLKKTLFTFSAKNHLSTNLLKDITRNLNHSVWIVYATFNVYVCFHWRPCNNLSWVYPLQFTETFNKVTSFCIQVVNDNSDKHVSINNSEDLRACTTHREFLLYTASFLDSAAVKRTNGSAGFDGRSPRFFSLMSPRSQENTLYVWKSIWTQNVGAGLAKLT